MDIEKELINVFKEHSAGPFLFLGSGFSRRYLGLEDWAGLLRKFCKTNKPFEYYLSIANGDNAEIATLLAKDFNTYWWESEEYKENIQRYSTKIKDETSALRIEIANYLKSLDQSTAKSSSYADEVEILSTLNVDGIITTNWDLFIEQLFPEYKTYIGQEELLFSNPQEIGEIYKIHGCSTKIESMVLTSADYHKFNERNPYLAAKLITLFVEHPIVFIGYSITDKNIKGLLSAIASCIGQNNIDKLRKNLIFVQRLKDKETPSITDNYWTIDEIQIPMTLVKTDSFIPVYKAIDATKRKIPARILRYCKEQLYELVQSSEPEKKICVLDIDQIDSAQDVEFLVGVGVAKREEDSLSSIGYSSIKVIDLITDLLHDSQDYDADKILKDVVPTESKSTPNIPVFKYLRRLGIDSQESYEKSEYELDKMVNRDIKSLGLKQYTRAFFRNYRHCSMDEIIARCTPENASAYIPLLPIEKVDIELLYQFLLANEKKLDYAESSYASNFRKLAYLYDRLKWGW